MPESYSPGGRAKLRVLVTGSTGFVGSALCRRLSSRAHFDVIPDHATPGQRPALETPGAMANFTTACQPDLVVHTAAISSIAACADDPARAERVNCTATLEVAEACRKIGAFLIFLSTDQVFDGRPGALHEDDPAHPRHIYGRTKLAAEEGLLQHPAASLILRISLVYGPSLEHPRSASESILLAARQNRPLSLFVDEFRRPLFIADLLDAIEFLGAARHAGRLHVAGPTLMSRHAFALEVLRARGCSEDMAVASHLTSSPLATIRPPCLDLACTALQAVMPWTPRTPAQALQHSKSE